jgi:hypothetical protein
MQLCIIFSCSTNVEKLRDCLSDIFYEEFCIVKLVALLFTDFFFNDTATTEIYTEHDTLSLHDALPILLHVAACSIARAPAVSCCMLLHVL